MMNIDTIHALQLFWIHWIQEFRTPFWDQFFQLLNFFDRNEFYVLLVSAIWYFISPTWGLRILFLTLTNSLINCALKVVFELPRPFHLDPSLEILSVPSYGFPSGAAQAAVILPIILIKEWKSPYAAIIGGLFFSLLSFSRIYLGVHFFTDILGGWVVGLFLAFTFYKLYPKIEVCIKKYPSDSLLLAYLAAIILFMLWAPMIPTIKSGFILIGAAIGLFYIKDRLTVWPLVKTFKEKLSLTLTNATALYLISYLGMGIIGTLFPHHKLVTVAMTSLMMGFFGTAVMPLLFSIYLNKVKA